MSLGRSALTIGIYTFLSRITGFVRDIMIAAILGASAVTDVFIVAFKLPNFFRRLFGEGAFNAAFVPMFSAKLTAEGKEKAQHFAENIFAIMFMFLLAFTLIIEVCMPLFMTVLAPGFMKNPEQFDLAVYLTRITFPYLLFICLVALMSGVLNSIGKFAAAAAAPIFLNLSMLGGLMLLKDKLDTPAHGLSIGVAVAGVVQFVWLYLACKRAGLPIRFKWPKIDPEVKRLLKLMIPGIIGAGIVQINLWIDTIIGTMVPNALSYLYYADRLNQLPLAIIGTAVGVAMLPLLSKQNVEGKKQAAVDTMNKALGLALFLVLPAAVGLSIMAHPIITVLFERGAFDSTASLATSYGLIAYAFGLPAFVMIKIFTPGFFAVHDTKTPVKIAIVALVLNLVFNLILILTFMKMGFYPHIAIALSTGLAAWINIWMLARILYRNGRFAPDAALKAKIFKTILCNVLMAAVLISLQKLAGNYLEKSEIVRLLTFGIIFSIGSAAYFGMAIMTKTISVAELKKLRRKK